MRTTLFKRQFRNYGDCFLRLIFIHIIAIIPVKITPIKGIRPSLRSEPMYGSKKSLLNFLGIFE